MEKENVMRANPLGSKPVGELLRNFAIPSVIAMLVGAIYNIVDQIFIGQYVGSLGNAATNICFPFSISCVAIALLFGIGGASNFNLAMGRREEADAAYYIGNSITALFGLGIILCVICQFFATEILVLFGSPDAVLPYALDYVRVTAYGFPFLILTTGGGHIIRADGSPRIAMLCNLSGAIINVGLDALFVAVMGMGMTGAALATIIGQFISGIIAIVYLTRYKTVKLQLKHLPIKVKYSLAIISLGAAPCFNQIAMMIVQIILNNSLKNYGAASVYGSEIPIAVSGIVIKVFQLFFAVVIGISQGVQPIFGFNYGAKQYSRVREAYKLALIYGAVISIIMFVLFQLVPRPIISIFGTGNETYYVFGEMFMRIYMFCVCVNFVQPITANFFTAIGKPKKGIFLSLTRQIIFLLPLIVVLPLFWGIDGLVYAGPIADTLAFVTAIFLAKGEFKKMKQLELEEN